LWHAGRIALADGNRARAVALWRDLAELADRTHLGFIELYRLEGEIVMAILDGHLGEAWTLTERYVSRADEAGASLRGREISMYMFLALADYLDRTEECLKIFEDYAARGLEMNHPLPIAYFVICLARLGRLEQARARAAPVLEREHAGRPDDPRDTNWLAVLLQSATVLEEGKAARALAEPLLSIANLSMAEWIPTTVARQLAAVALLAGETRMARSYYALALEAAEKIGFRPELAIIRVQLAELFAAEADYFGALSQLALTVPGRPVDGTAQFAFWWPRRAHSIMLARWLLVASGGYGGRFDHVVDCAGDPPAAWFRSSGASSHWTSCGRCSSSPTRNSRPHSRRPCRQPSSKSDPSSALASLTASATHSLAKRCMTKSSRRIRFHQQVAHALEEVHALRLEGHAAELAEHYAFSSDPLDLAKAIHDGELAPDAPRTCLPTEKRHTN
jgi:hypothetical protein